MNDVRISAECSMLSTGSLTERIAAIEIKLSSISRSIDELHAKLQQSTALDEFATLVALTRDVEAVAMETTAVSNGHAALAVAEAAPVEDAVTSIPLALLCLDSEQLTLIKGLDAEAARILNEAGIHRFADIAALTPEDVSDLGRMIGNGRRISTEGWIEQATLLADGIMTAHVRRIRTGDLGCVVAKPLPVAAVPAAPTKSNVMSLASRRPAPRSRGGNSAASGLLKLAACAVLAYGLTASGYGVAPTLKSIVGSVDACGSSLAVLWGKCTIAYLP